MPPTLRVLALLALVACSEAPSGTNPAPADAYFRLYHTAKSAGDLTVRVDGRTVRSHVPFGALADSLPVGSGSHRVSLVPSSAGRSAGSALVAFQNGRLTTFVVLDSLNVLIPQPLTDTGLLVPPGQSRLRVAHLADSTPPLVVTRLQPDYPDPVNVMFPFAYGAVSPYIPSTPGDWWVFAVDTLAHDTLTVGPITIPEQQERTVVLIEGDSTGLQALILDP
jgi:hypothetical protein